MRRKEEITITDANRDKGKTFILEEMSAWEAERWANRAIIAVGKSNAMIEHVEGMGVAGIAIMGFKTLLGVQEEKALQLLDELMKCVKIKMEAAPEGRPLVESDIEEPTTLWQLKKEVFLLHTGFTSAEIRQTLISAAQSLASSSIRPTSRARSRKSSRPARQRSKS